MGRRGADQGTKGGPGEDKEFTSYFDLIKKKFCLLN